MGFVSAVKRRAISVGITGSGKVFFYRSRVVMDEEEGTGGFYEGGGGFTVVAFIEGDAMGVVDLVLVGLELLHVDHAFS